MTEMVSSMPKPPAASMGALIVNTAPSTKDRTIESGGQQCSVVAAVSVCVDRGHTSLTIAPFGGVQWKDFGQASVVNG
jgi:hypothetical protein